MTNSQVGYIEKIYILSRYLPQDLIFAQDPEMSRHTDKIYFWWVDPELSNKIYFVSEMDLGYIFGGWTLKYHCHTEKKYFVIGIRIYFVRIYFSGVKGCQGS